MEYVTTNLYFWSMGAMIGIVSTIVGYWVKEVKGLGKSLDDHNTNNGIRFLKYNKANWGLGAARDVRGSGFYGIN